MSEMANKKIAILNLAHELSSELEDYFAQKQILVANHESLSPAHGWTHILAKGVEDFSELQQIYATKEKNIKIISLSAVDNLENFASSNGKLIFDEIWMRSNLGIFILDKFFQEYGGVAIRDSYPTFKEKGSFHIANPFNTGEYLDRLVYSAFSDGFSALSIKTFFDHLLMFLTGLKKQGKVGLPIEVSYGNFEDVFGIQLNFLTQNLTLDEVTNSFSGEISKNVDKYLLNIATRSCDFFDFTSLSEVNKTVITGLWLKDDRIRSSSSGLLLNELSTSATITHYPTEGITSYQSSNPMLQDFSEDVTVTSSPGKKEEGIHIGGVSRPNEAVSRFNADSPAEAFSQTVKGQMPEEGEHKVVLSGTEKEDDLITLVKGTIEEEKEQVFKISGGKQNFDVDKFAFRVTSNLEKKSEEDDVLKVTSLKEFLPESIKSGFQDFASRLNKQIEELTENDLEEFKDKEVPKIIKDTTKKVDNSRWAVSSTGQLNQVEQQVQGSDKTLELKIKALNNENENLKNKMKTLLAEVRILKDSKSQMAEVNMKALMVAEASTIHQSDTLTADAALRDQLQQKISVNKELNNQDLNKLSALLERESKYLERAKEEGIQLKKMQIEATQKESFFTQELEKMNRQLKARDLVVTKTKESFTKLVSQKDHELKILNEKLEQAAKAMVNNTSQTQAQQIRDLEKKIINHEKMIEIYKSKIIEKPVVATEDVEAREENRKLQMINNQMKNQLEVVKKDIAKYQAKTAQDLSTITTLKSDKQKLEQELKKAAQEAKKDEVAALAHQNVEKEVKRLQGTIEAYEAQLKDAQVKSKDLEAKLQEALKNQKKDTGSDEPAAAKGKTAQLENNVRKLTQDLVESRNQLSEVKKETNKLRQEKTALQNQLDKLKRETEKAKPAAAAAPKKPGTGGKAA